MLTMQGSAALITAAVSACFVLAAVATVVVRAVRRSRDAVDSASRRNSNAAMPIRASGKQRFPGKRTYRRLEALPDLPEGEDEEGEGKFGYDESDDDDDGDDIIEREARRLGAAGFD